MADDGEDGHELVRMTRVPSRRHGAKTKDAILASAAQLLEDVGFERLSTNMICTHAGITPPALYRYFPNKYAVLFGLAHSLLVDQRAALNTWLADDGFGWQQRIDGVGRVCRLQASLRSVADARTGAIWVMRAMRAIPKLREVRTVAQSKMLDDLIAGLASTYPVLSASQLDIPARLISEIITMGTELEMDDPSLDTDRIRQGIALAVATYLEAVTESDQDSGADRRRDA